MKKMRKNRSAYRCSRRTLLRGAIGGGALLSLWPSGLHAVTAPERRFVGLYFNGGWDVLLGPDARDPAKTYSRIELNTDRLPANPFDFRDPIPVTIGGTEVLWGAAMSNLARHADVTTLFRGVNMNTVAHAAGRAYVNTFLRPAGDVARGDSFATRMAAGSGGSQILPNVAITTRTYNVSFAPEVSGIRLGSANQVASLLEPRGALLDDTTAALLRTAQDDLDGCLRTRSAVAESQFQTSRNRMRMALEQNLADRFNFDGSDVATRYGITDPRAGSDPAVIAATVHTLLDTGLSRAVTAQIQGGLDTHFGNWAEDQPTRLKAGFDAMAVLLDDLKRTDPGLKRTTVVAYSEFARTPHINGRGGRDHHFAGSVLVFGGGLRPGVIGATIEDTLGIQGVDVETGLPQEGGHVLMPEDIGATLAAAAGADASPFRVAPLSAWIQGGAA